MGVPLHTALVYYVFPVFAFSIISFIFYQVLSTPLGWFIVPALAGVAAWVRYARNTEKKIKNGERYNAIVVGAGFSGLCMGAKLSEGGVPFTIFEASTEVGGTWHHNTYLGCACDVSTTLYQFTFFQNPDWSRCVTPAEEIKEYLITFTKEYDLYGHIQFDTRVKSAVWKEEEGM